MEPILYHIVTQIFRSVCLQKQLDLLLKLLNSTMSALPTLSAITIATVHSK